jgi:hypothetical protein
MYRSDVGVSLAWGAGQNHIRFLKLERPQLRRSIHVLDRRRSLAAGPAEAILPSAFSYACSLSHRRVTPINIDQAETRRRPSHVGCVVLSSDESDGF